VTFVEELLRSLNEARVRYLVVGGLAVVLHGHARLTLDVDLIVDLEPDNARRTMDALSGLGLTPSVPVDAASFADPETRRRWIDERNMQAFPMRDVHDLTRRVDVFVEEPFPFQEMWASSIVVPYGVTETRIVSLEHLLAMKRAAGRHQDLADIEALEAIHQRE